MEEGPTVWSNEDRYVTRMNQRHEKLLKKQLEILKNERKMKTKTLDSSRRTFVEHIRRLDLDPSEHAHLSKDVDKMVSTEKRKELDRLLKSLLHRPYETRAGYSYIEYLARNMQPLVKRPLQWGINPPLSAIQEEAKKKAEPSVFLTQIKGQTIALTRRTTIPNKGKIRKEIALPPIVNTVKSNGSSPTPVKFKPSIKKSNRMEQTVKDPRKNHNSTTLKEKSQPQNPQKGNRRPLNKGSQDIPSNVSMVTATMATLKVPSPTFHSFAEVAEEEENLQNLEKNIGQQIQVVVSQSQLRYSIAIRARFLNRRKSI